MKIFLALAQSIGTFDDLVEHQGRWWDDSHILPHTRRATWDRAEMHWNMGCRGEGKLEAGSSWRPRAHWLSLATRWGPRNILLFRVYNILKVQTCHWMAYTMLQRDRGTLGVHGHKFGASPIPANEMLLNRGSHPMCGQEYRRVFPGSGISYEASRN